MSFLIAVSITVAPSSASTVRRGAFVVDVGDLRHGLAVLRPYRPSARGAVNPFRRRRPALLSDRTANRLSSPSIPARTGDRQRQGGCPCCSTIVPLAMTELVPAQVPRGPRRGRRCGDAAGARGAGTAGQDPDRHAHHFYPPAYLKMQHEYEGARKIPPNAGVSSWTSSKLDRADGQERHPHRGAVARLHARACGSTPAPRPRNKTATHVPGLSPPRCGAIIPAASAFSRRCR